MRKNVSWNGLAALNAKLAGLVPAMAGKLGVAVYQEAEAIMTDSKENHVPVDTGTLRSSGYVSPPKVSGLHVSVELGFGGQASGYAVQVHENLNAYHPVGGPKYLERPVMAAESGMAQRIANRVKL